MLLTSNKTLTIYTISSVKLTHDISNENTLPHNQISLGACDSPDWSATTRWFAAVYDDPAMGGVTPTWTRCMVNSESQHDLNAIFRQNIVLRNINKEVYCK